jgi:hypothetical protein
MKFKSLFFILFAIGLNAQGVHQDRAIRNGEGSTTFRILATASDTSEIWPAYEIMSARFWVGDSIGGVTDSSSITFTLQGSPGANATGVLAGYVTLKTWSVTTDSTLYDYAITGSAIPNISYVRYILTGGAANRKLNLGSIVKVMHMNYNSAIRN